MKKKILVVIAILLFIFILLSVVTYLNKPLILDKAKTILLDNIKASTGRTVRIGKIDFNLLQGFLIHDLEISEKPPLDKSAFLTIKEISFNPVLFPFILKKNIFIPSVNVSGLNANITRIDKANWNFSDIFASMSSKPKTKPKFSFTVLKINLSDSQVTFQDNTFAVPFVKKLKDLSLVIKPSLPKSAKFDLKAEVDQENSKILSSGRIDFSTKQTAISMNLDNLSISEYLAYLNNIPFSLKNGRLSTKLACNFNKELLQLEGTGSVVGITIIKDKLEIHSDLNSKFKIDYNPKNQAKPLNYEALINLSNTKASGLPYIKEINSISGRLKLSLDKLIFDETKGNSLFGPLTLSGSLYNFANPELDVKIKSILDLARLKDVLGIKNAEIGGVSDTELTVKGPLSSLENLNYAGKASVSGAKFNTDYLPEPIKDIKATVNFDKNRIVWKDLTAKFQQETYTSSGSLDNFLNPIIKFNLSSSKINLEGDVALANKILTISKLDGSLLKSKFDIKGEVNISNVSNPLLNISGDADIDLNDLGSFNSNIKDILDNTKLSGATKAKIILVGRLKDRSDWQASLRGSSKLISIYGLKINDVNLDYSQDNSPIANIVLVGKPYSGELAIKNQVDLSKENFPFVLKINLNGVDLALLKNDTPIKEKEISGKFFGDASLQGSYKDVKNSLNGFGNIHIEDGNLWQLEMLKGLGQFLLITEFQKINFKEASGDFTIENKKISTEDFTLSSDPLNMLLEGYIDFDGNINFKVTTQVAEGLIKSPTDIQGIFSSILSQSTNAITIQLTGTLKNPKYKIIPIPGQIFKKAKDFIFEEILP